MRIQCPFCGERDLSEFVYLGDAAYERPEPNGPKAPREFVVAVYMRNNPAGPHAELWFHRAGCRSWLRVTRDTRTHEIFEVVLVKRVAKEVPEGIPKGVPCESTATMDRAKSHNL